MTKYFCDECGMETERGYQLEAEEVICGVGQGSPFLGFICEACLPSYLLKKIRAYRRGE